MEQMTSARFFYRDPDAPRPNRPLRLVVVAFVERTDPERGDTVLMERRSDNGQWCLLGGGIETDQSVEDALRQEVHEESGLTVASCSLFGVFSDPSMIAQYDMPTERRISRVVSLAFRVRVDDFGALQISPESTELRFFTHDELRALEIIPTVRHIVDRYLEDRSSLVLG
jgi:8-oxo-dGTP pyrophosphatase MutT (NUDIX family)